MAQTVILPTEAFAIPLYQGTSYQVSVSSFLEVNTSIENKNPRTDTADFLLQDHTPVESLSVTPEESYTEADLTTYDDPYDELDPYSEEEKSLSDQVCYSSGPWDYRLL